MTLTTVQPPVDRPQPLDLGHPVRSFVLVLLALALGLVVLQWSGVLLPRITNFQGQQGGATVNGAAEWKAVVISNDAPLPVRVESLSWPTTNATNVRVDVLPAGVDGPAGPPALSPSTPVTPFTLAGGEKRVVVVSGDTTCPEFNSRQLRLEVRTSLGIERVVTIDGTGSPDVGPCP